MAHEAAIVQRSEGKTIDEEYLKIVTSEYNGYIGLMIPLDGDGNPGTITSQVFDDVEEALTDIKDTAEGVTSPFVIICGKGCIDEDRQPFIIMTKDDKTPLCTVMLEGNFAGSGFEPNGNESHCDEWYVVQQYLLPKLTRLAGDLDENQAKMVEYLEDKFNQNEILKSICPLVGARCEVLILFSNGQTVNLKKGDLHRSFEWGETSNALTYGNGPTATPEPENKAKGILGKLANKAKTSVPMVGSQNSTETLGNKTATAMSAALDAAKKEETRSVDDRPYLKPPGRRCDSEKNLNSWYMYACGYLPEGWEQGVKHSDRAIPARAKKELWMNEAKWNEQLSKGSIIIVKGDKAPAVVRPEGATEIKTDLLTVQQRKGLVEVFKPKLVKSLDGKSSFVEDPVKLAEDLKNKELLSQAMPGVFPEGIATVFSWGSDAFKLLIKQDPDAATMLFEELRFRLWQAHGQIKQGKDKIAM